MSKEAFKGRWFKPEKQAEKIAGTLFINDEGRFHLDLVGNFSGPHDLNEKINIILGLSSNGKYFTLVDSYLVGHNMASGGFSTSAFSPGLIIIGGHYEKYNEIKFKVIDFKFKSLDNWLGVYGFEPIKIDEKKSGKIQINYDLPEKISFYIDSDVIGEFNFFVNTGILHFTKEIKITQSASIRLIAKNELPLEKLLNLIFQFQTFFGLAYFNYPKIESIEGIEVDEIDETNFAKIRIIINTSDSFQTKDYFDFLFKYSDIQDSLKDILMNWFSRFEKIKPVLGGLIQSFNKENKVTEFNFLGIVQSLETLHRRIRKNAIHDKQEFKAEVGEIIDSVPSKYKEWVRERFLYANEPTLINRLKELLGELPESLKQKLFTDEEKFVISVKDSRNYYTHYSLHLADKALKDGELFYATEKLKVILIALLLKEIGILNETFEKKFLERGRRIFYHTFHDFKSYAP
jgi:hypothetical protein